MFEELSGDKAPAVMDPGALVVLGCSGTSD